MVLSVVPVDSQLGDLAHRIQRDKWVYITRTGDDHAPYATFREYMVHENRTADSKYRMFTFPNALSKNGITALRYGGGTVVAQSTWWACGQIKWLKRPIILPIIVAATVATGVTPAHIYELLVWISYKAAPTGLQMIVNFSSSWMCDYWFLVCLVAAFAVQWTIVAWRNRKPTPPESRTTTKATPIADDLSVVSRKTSDEGGGRDPQLCQISYIMRNGDPNNMMCRKTCPKEACFVLPMGGGDKLCPGASNGSLRTAVHASACALCTDHLETYQRHIVACACRSVGCAKMGLPFPTDKGTVFECRQHTKERLLKGDPVGNVKDPVSTAPKRRVKKLPPKEEEDIPIMPHLETMGPGDCPPFPHSSYSATLSTGTSSGDLKWAIKQIGGRGVNANESDLKMSTVSDNPPQPTSVAQDNAPCSRRKSVQREHKSDRECIRPHLSSLHGSSNSTATTSSDPSESGIDSGSSESTRKGNRDRERRGETRNGTGYIAAAHLSHGPHLMILIGPFSRSFLKDCVAVE